MRGRKVAATSGAGALAIALVVGTTTIGLPVGPASATAEASAPAAGWVLTARSPGTGYAPPFTGNGWLGVRVPPAGQGFEAAPVATQSEVAGFYGRQPGSVEERADLPTWSSLTLVDGGRPFSLTSGRVAGWRQSLDLRTGVVTTTARWTAPDGHRTRITTDVWTDRAVADVGVVRLTITPSWSGPVAVDDTIDGTDAVLTRVAASGHDAADDLDWETVSAAGTGMGAALADRVEIGGGVHATDDVAPVEPAQTVGQRLTFPVVAGRTYTVTKYVAVTTSAGGDPDAATLAAASPTGASPTGGGSPSGATSGATPAATPAAGPLAAAARSAATGAARTGYDRLLGANDRGWAQLWAGRIDVVGDRTLATEVDASEFALWASVRDGVDWSVPPSGLSSDGYEGHVFWDAETWIYPALLAQHPDLAQGIDTYRQERLGAAEAHARATGYRGARFPWESAIGGDEQIPPPGSLFTEGLYEQHVTADVALAQWQYYLATGDRAWLVRRGWPVIAAAADFWASRVTPTSSGTATVDGVTGPDEENADVDSDAYTIAAARATLLDAVAAARVVGTTAPAAWRQVADRLQVPVDPALGIVPEFAGYRGQLVKQADVTMLTYPWQVALPTGVAQRDLDYYVARTDPHGPSMSDAIDAIDASALDSPGCSAAVYTEASVAPYVRDDFDQFSETSSGGTFTFITGIGGFLQEFLYGYTGLRWSAGGLRLAPSLVAPLRGIVVHQIAWHGRRVTVAIGPRTTTVTLDRGSPLPVVAPGVHRTLSAGHPVTVTTRRPDRSATTDLARCAPVTASSASSASPALAAVDGSPATGWQPLTLPARLDVTLARTVTGPVTVTVTWGVQWPSPASPDVAPRPGPTVTRRPASYRLETSADGRTWRTVATVTGRAGEPVDTFHLTGLAGRRLALVVTAAAPGIPPLLDELSVTG